MNAGDCRQRRVADEDMDRQALRLALELHACPPRARRNRAPPARVASDGDDVEADDLALALDARGDVDAVADGRIVEAALEPHIAHQRLAGGEPDADGDAAEAAVAR